MTNDHDELRQRATKHPGAGRAKAREIIHKAIALALQARPVRAYLRYAEHRGTALADSVTYRALFSLFAAVLLGFSIAALWLGDNPDAMRGLTRALDSVIPGLSDAVNLRAVEAPTEFTLVGIVSCIGLLVAAIGAMGSLRYAIRVLADEHYEVGNGVLILLRQFLVTLAFGGLLLFAAGLSLVNATGLRGFAEMVGIAAPEVVFEGMARVVGVAVVFVIDAVALALMFRLLSGLHAPARALWYGALVGAVGLVVLQELSGLFVRGATSNPLLASFAALVALLLWVNLSSQVILFACSLIIVGAAEARDRVRERFGASTLAQLGRRRAEDRVAAAKRALREAQREEQKELDRASRVLPAEPGLRQPR